MCRVIEIKNGAPPPEAELKQGVPDKPKVLEDLEALCAQKHLRMTGQRRVIAEVLACASDHPDVEEVYRRAADIDGKISLSTVYRTMRLFEEAGIIEKHDFGDGRARYEQSGGEHHDHLVDTETGEVIEFCNPEIEELQKKVAESLGYELVGHKLELYGVRIKTGKKNGKTHPDNASGPTGDADK